MKTKILFLEKLLDDNKHIMTDEDIKDAQEKINMVKDVKGEIEFRIKYLKYKNRKPDMSWEVFKKLFSVDPNARFV